MKANTVACKCVMRHWPVVVDAPHLSTPDKLSFSLDLRDAHPAARWPPGQVILDAPRWSRDQWPRGHGACSTVVAPLLGGRPVTLGSWMGGSTPGNKVQGHPPATWPHSITLLVSGACPFFALSTVLHEKQILKKMRWWRRQEGGISAPWRGERATPRDASSAGRLAELV